MCSTRNRPPCWDSDNGHSLLEWWWKKDILVIDIIFLILIVAVNFVVCTLLLSSDEPYLYFGMAGLTGLVDLLIGEMYYKSKALSWCLLIILCIIVYAI